MMKIEYICTKCGDMITGRFPLSFCHACGGGLRLREQHLILVRDYNQTYIARSGKTQASCTAGRRLAAEALAGKLFKEKVFFMECINDSTYLATEERET